MIRVLISLLVCSLWADLQPLGVLEKALDEILATNSKFAAEGQVGSERHVSQLLEVAKAYVDFEEMARRSFGRIWAVFSDEQKKEAQTLLAEVLARTYVGNLSRASRNSVKFLSQSLAGDKAEVKSEVADKDFTQKALLIYRLKKVDSRWQVYDVLIDNVSLTANYRSEFASIYDRRGYEGLIQELKNKVGNKK